LLGERRHNEKSVHEHGSGYRGGKKTSECNLGRHPCRRGKVSSCWKKERNQIFLRKIIKRKFELLKRNLLRPFFKGEGTEDIPGEKPDLEYILSRRNLLSEK